MADVTLSRAIRSNLLHLQNTASMMDTTQERLATGLKVNSALDNPTNFFTASALRARASDISTLLDSMGNGIRTIEAADNGLTAITNKIESMQSALRQARQDRTFDVRSFALDLGATPGGTEQLSLTGGALAAPVNIALTTTVNSATPASASGSTTGLSTTSTLAAAGVTGTGDITISDGTTTHTFAVTNAGTQTIGDLITSINGNAALRVTASVNGNGEFTLAADTNTTGITVGGSVTTGVTGLAASTPAPTASNQVTAKTVDQLVNEINSNADTKGKVRATNDNGKLRIENLSTLPLALGGYNATTGAIDGASSNPVELDGNKIRANLAVQFNELKAELDRLAEDSSFNGVNLLRGDELKIVFNETGTSEIRIVVKDADGVARPINAETLGLRQISETDLNTDAQIDALLKDLTGALAEVRTQSSSLGAHLSTVQNREDFTKRMMNTLETGAANLTLADTNEEAANLLALQTRQQLSQTALSLASQADQAVLRLFG